MQIRRGILLVILMKNWVDRSVERSREKKDFLIEPHDFVAILEAEVAAFSQTADLLERSIDKDQSPQMTLSN